MPAKRDVIKPPTRKELLFAIAGEDVSNSRLMSLQRLLVCLERRPDLHAALSAAIAEEWMRDIGAEPGTSHSPEMDTAVRAVIRDLTDMAVDFERVLEREGVY